MRLRPSPSLKRERETRCCPFTLEFIHTFNLPASPFELAGTRGKLLNARTWLHFALVDEPYEFSSATIKSQRFIGRAITRAHRDCAAACETRRFRNLGGRRLDEPRELINILESHRRRVSPLNSPWCSLISKSTSYLSAQAWSGSATCVRACVHMTWNKWWY